MLYRRRISEYDEFEYRQNNINNNNCIFRQFQPIVKIVLIVKKSKKNHLEDLFTDRELVNNHLDRRSEANSYGELGIKIQKDVKKL